jgi:uncharacterized phage-like protein YoqJ
MKNHQNIWRQVVWNQGADVHTACFSGYRAEKFPFALEKGRPRFTRLMDDLRAAISQAAEDGYTDFLCGMAHGFDLLAAEVVMGLQDGGGSLGGIRLVSVLPFAGHCVPEPWVAIHALAQERSSQLVTLATEYRPGTYANQNRYMVERASRLICFFDGRPGGTAQTVRYARKMEREIVNLASLR